MNNSSQNTYDRENSLASTTVARLTTQTFVLPARLPRAYASANIMGGYSAAVDQGVVVIDPGSGKCFIWRLKIVWSAESRCGRSDWHGSVLTRWRRTWKK
jgi:hypothetical protein